MVEQLSQQQDKQRNFMDELFVRAVVPAIVMVGSIGVGATMNARAQETHSDISQAIIIHPGEDPGDKMCRTKWGHTACVYGLPEGLKFTFENFEPVFNNVGVSDLTNLETHKVIFPHGDSLNWNGSSSTFNMTNSQLGGAGEFSGTIVMINTHNIFGKAYEFNIDLVTGRQGTKPIKNGCQAGESHLSLTNTRDIVFAYKGLKGCLGYYTVNNKGEIETYGEAPFKGDATFVRPRPKFVAAAETPDQDGYWLASSEGKVIAYGDAKLEKSSSGDGLDSPVVDMATTPDGKGYWLVDSEGDVRAYGDATFEGGIADKKLDSPVAGMATTPDGKGYWLVSQNGGIYSFGDAKFHGSEVDKTNKNPVVGMISSPNKSGYRIISSNGNVYSFDAPYFGSLGGKNLSNADRVINVAPSSGGDGYYMVGANGEVYAFGDASCVDAPYCDQVTS
jgi:hypothetical protein